MTLLFKNNNVKLEAYDIHSVVNPRSLVPDFNRFESRVGVQTKRMVFKYDAVKGFKQVDHMDPYKPAQPIVPYKVLDYTLGMSKIKPKHDDCIEFRIQRKIVHPFYGDDITTFMPVQAKLMAISCVNTENIMSNVYTFRNKEGNILQSELCKGFMFLVNNDSEDVEMTSSNLSLVNDCSNGVEDVLIISYMKERDAAIP
jgi:hypothetical protein